MILNNRLVLSFFLLCAIAGIVWVFAFANNPQHVFTLKILDREEHEIFGGLGDSNSSLGCASNLRIEENSSLTFKCGETDAFKDLIYIFADSTTFYACPTQEFSGCLECAECATRSGELKGLNINQ